MYLGMEAMRRIARYMHLARIKDGNLFRRTTITK